jgi:UDP:flavonoid glycosyltransferase YjiC (YdhE family)
MRVLFTTRGSSGHVGPLAPFAHACVRAGQDVTVAAQRQFEGNVTRLGLTFAPFDAPGEDEWMPLMAGFAEMSMEEANRAMIGEFFAGLDLRAELPALREIVERTRPDVIVRESWEFASTLVAELNDVPMARVGLGLLELEAQAAALAAGHVDEARGQLGLAPDPIGARLTDAPLLTTVPRELENADTPEPAKLTRYRFPVRAEEDGLRDWWPGNDDPLVYLTFGSVAAGGHLPYYPQLYSWAIETLASLQIRLLVTVGDGERDLADLGAVPANVHVETWVPHDAAVRQADVVVCHGGFGSTLGTLAHAVPLVVLPLFSSDQWANGEAVARAGAGLNVADDVSTRRVLDLPPREVVEGLAAAVKSALSDATYRREATRISDAMQALPPVDESVQVLEEIAT